MHGLRIPHRSFAAFPLLSGSAARQTPLDIVAVCRAIITVCGLVAYAAALAIAAEALL